MVRISDTAFQQAKGLGLHYLCDNLPALLRSFAKDAAIVTHPYGNRRYGGYVLQIENETVESIHQYEPGRVCDDCHGVGFHRIMDRGKDFHIPCQSCSG